MSAFTLQILLNSTTRPSASCRRSNTNGCCTLLYSINRTFFYIATPPHMHTTRHPVSDLPGLLVDALRKVPHSCACALRCSKPLTLALHVLPQKMASVKKQVNYAVLKFISVFSVTSCYSLGGARSSRRAVVSDRAR